MTIVFAVWLAAGWAVALKAETPAERMLALARQAIGGADGVERVRTLTATGRFRRVLAEMEMEGELDLALQPPDKLLRTETLRLRGHAITRQLGVNGSRLLRSTRNQADGSRADPFALPKGAPRVVSEEELERGLVRLQRAEMARLLMVWLVTPPPGWGLDLTYVGRAESPEGAADVIEARGPHDFWARLFLDARTHRPLLLAYQGVRPPGRSRPSPSAVTPPPLEEFQLFVADYRTVGPLVLPHRVTVSVGADTTEEWDIDTFRINPPLDADAFEPRP
jgi:hypothetical protein